MAAALHRAYAAGWLAATLASALLLIEIGLTVRDLRRTRLSDRAGR